MRASVMTTAAIVAALAIVASTVTGGDHGGESTCRGVPGSVQGVPGLVHQFQPYGTHSGGCSGASGLAQLTPASPKELRIPFLSADGVAAPEPVATATAVPVSGVTPIPEPSPNPLSIPEIICSVSWPCQEAISVATCESGLNPRAVNPSSGTLGLFQLHPKFHTWRFHGGDPFDPVVNTAAAFSLYEEQGWLPWIECWRW